MESAQKNCRDQEDQQDYVHLFQWKATWLLRMGQHVASPSWSPPRAILMSGSAHLGPSQPSLVHLWIFLPSRIHKMCWILLLWSKTILQAA
jgi:hypothetical protein